MPIASSLLDKPRLVKKLKDFYTYVQKNDGKVGTKTRGIDLNFNNACNLRCKYCFTNSPKGDHVKEYLDINAIRKLADDAETECRNILKENLEELHLVAKGLLEYETLSGDEIKDLINGITPSRNDFDDDKNDKESTPSQSVPKSSSKSSSKISPQTN